MRRLRGAGASHEDDAMNRRDLGRALLLLGSAGAAHAQEGWPARPLRMIVPSAPGAGSDIVGRVLAEKLAKALGQPIAVENRPGSSGVIANGEAAQSRPDGYTLLFCGYASMVVNPWFYKKLPYRPLEDFAPVAQVGAGGNLLLVHPRVPAQDIRTLAEWARGQKAPPPFATWGVGSSGHAAMEQLMQSTGARFEHVVYKGVPQLLQDLVAGQIGIGWADPMVALPLVNEGKVRALGIAATQRAPRLPQVPTLAEQQVPLDLDGWYGLFVRAGTPPAVVDRLHAAVTTITRDPEFLERMHALNLNAAPPRTPAQFAQVLRSETQRWGDLVRRMGVEPQ
jgi:tripartite-type tricarboxylate transporter receptor subunit TctC